MTRRKSNSPDTEQTMTWIFLAMLIGSLISGLVGSALHQATT